LEEVAILLLTLPDGLLSLTDLFQASALQGVEIVTKYEDQAACCCY
jgi:hypothetical protein